MKKEEVDILKRALEREKKARKEAEKILETKSLELYNTTLALKKTNQQLEKNIYENQSQIKGFFKSFNDAFVQIDIHGNVKNMNNNASALFEYDLSKESLNVVDVIYKEDFDYAMKSFKELLAKGYFSNYTARIITKSKQIK
ncbi:PAS domain-containing protein [Polaribacter tangerinus]